MRSATFLWRLVAAAAAMSLKARNIVHIGSTLIRNSCQCVNYCFSALVTLLNRLPQALPQLSPREPGASMTVRSPCSQI